jgi:multimeric flavodoxin WrbA
VTTVKRILGIVGSPRRNGNTHLLVQRILDGAREGGAEVELVLLKDLVIHECDGCHACWEGKPCSKPDDMPAIYEKIAASDGIIFGTPVYWYGPTALMKAFLDRFVYFNSPENRPQIRGKLAVLAVPYEEESAETAGPLVAMFEKSFAYLEMDLVAKVLVPGVGEKKDILKKEAVLQEAFELGAGLGQPKM